MGGQKIVNALIDKGPIRRSLVILFDFYYISSPPLNYILS